MTADAGKLRAALESWSLRVQTEAVDRTPDAVRPLAPIGTETPTSTRAPGQLRESIRVSEPVSGGGTSFRGRVSAPVIQAVTTDQGSPPHVIEPRGPGYPLRFYWARAGGIVFRMHVNHPGNPAQHWWEPAVRAAWASALLQAAVGVPFGGP